MEFPTQKRSISWLNLRLLDGGKWPQRPVAAVIDSFVSGQIQIKLSSKNCLALSLTDSPTHLIDVTMPTPSFGIVAVSDVDMRKH